MNTCVVTGCTGQLGSYLCEFLIEKGYFVVGTTRRRSNPNLENISSIINNNNFKLINCDITDYSSVSGLFDYNPIKIFNTAAQSFVSESFKAPFETFDADTKGVLNFLEVMREKKSDCVFINSNTSEQFGKSYSSKDIYVSNIGPATGLTKDGKKLPPEEWLSKYIHKYQDEDTKMVPQSPYGVSKLATYHLIRLYRECYKLNCAAAIMFNNESPRRGKEFVTRKITDYVGKLAHDKLGNILLDNYPKLRLGNLFACRDWSFSGDMAKAQYLLSEQKNLDDFVFGSERTHTVKEFCQKAFSLIGEDYENWVIIDPEYYRPAEVDILFCDCKKARNILGWQSTYSFDQLVSEMVNADVQRHRTK